MSSQTYFDLCPKESVALCIPFNSFSDVINDFISKYGNPVELFEIWFNNNYPDYFNILKFDNNLIKEGDIDKVKHRYTYKYLINKLFKCSKQYGTDNIIQSKFFSNLNSTDHIYNLIKMDNKFFNMFYPIIYEQNYPEVYKEIIKYYKINNMINNSKILLKSLAMLISLRRSYPYMITLFDVKSELKILIIKSSGIEINKLELYDDDFVGDEDDEFLKYLIENGANVE